MYIQYDTKKGGDMYVFVEKQILVYIWFTFVAGKIVCIAYQLR